MKLGTQTGSMTNHILSRATIGQPEPQVGMGVTILGWTDRYAGTIVYVGPTVITVQEDYAKRTDNNGMSECQQYEYTPNPQGRIYCFRQNRHGGWDEVVKNDTTNRWNKTEGSGLRIGERGAYRDFSF